MSEVRRKRKRRKKSKKALWITLIVLLIIVGGGWAGIYQMTHRDIQAEDIGVEQDFFDFSEFELELDPEAITDNQPNKDAQENNDINPSGEAKGGGKEPANSPSDEPPGKQELEESNPSTPVVVDKEKEIENKYIGIFARLEDIALSRLDTLAANAIKDYKAGRSIADISSVYTSAANKLQGKVDAAFYNQLNLMKNELKANGLDNSLAIQAETKYQQAISSKKSELMEKVVKFSGK